MNYQAAQSDPGAADWWASVVMPGDFDPVNSRYKIGIHKESAPSWFPGGPDAVTRKVNMLTRFEVNGFNAETVEYFPHFDYAQAPGQPGNFLTTTGLEEGFHILKARAFLNRQNQTSIYNTFKQSFYYDAERPQGEIRFPENNGDTVGGSNYGVVVRTDNTVTEVWYNIADQDPSNDDSSTGARNGNGIGFEPFTDTNRNGTWDSGEEYEDINGNQEWDDDLAESWVRATEVTPSLQITPSDPSYVKEFRFNFDNIPPSIIGDGTAQIGVRLREISSSDLAEFSLSDVDGHYTTLTRNVNVDGPDERMFVAFPSFDGQVVDDMYVMKVYFSKILADGLSEQQLIDRFLIRIGSNEEGDAGIAQSRDGYSIEYNATADFHALAFDLPNLYNDIEEYLHRITILHDRPTGQSDLTATRLVRAFPVTTPRVLIVNPPELGSDGRPFEIVMPDVASPSPSQRQFTIQVATNLDATNVVLNFVDLKGSTVSAPTSVDEGNSKLWDYVWTVVEPGRYRFTATVTSPGGTAEADRNTTVAFRQVVDGDDDDTDDDDDGLLDIDENTTQVLPNQSPDGGITPAPKPNPEQWTNGEVHIYYAFGRTNPFSPDSDGDLLPDGLEVGWRSSINPPTDPTADTDGDGTPNFVPDLDPPFYNTLDNFGRVPDVNSQSEGGDRARQLYGSTTDPSNPDSDGDGILDGIEDANRNGWVDGDGQSLDPTFDPWLERNWPDGVIGPSETWTETDPNNNDTDDDDLTDGFGEDQNFDGVIEGDANTNRVYDAGEAWGETDPLNRDTDGDGLPDGWEVNNGLDPLDNGIDNYATATPDDGNVDMGANGDPDGDGILNITELTNGTRPNVDDSLPPPPANSIVIGPGETETYGNLTNDNAFTDWTIGDLLVLDEYQGNGTNNQGTDIYRGWDGFDLSRDIVAFYFRDGGADGRLYFRLDFHDLTALAEEGNLDMYVVIDTGNTEVGESAFPEDLDTRTEMKWEALVAVYQSNNGAVYLDTDAGINTTAIAEDVFTTGVVRRDQTHPDGFEFAYFNAELDAAEFSIKRQALLDAGWNGNADTLNFQVFTTKDGTQNGPVVGGGDLGGRSDIRDSIYDDYIASDHWRAQGNISGSGSVLYSWFGKNAGNDIGKRAKVALVVHGNQPIKPGNEMQDLINDDAGAGYYRLVDAHGAFGLPVNLHFTATLASAIQWASVDPSAGKPWRDGPTLNQRISDLLGDGTATLLATTFSDHMLPFTPLAYTADNIALAGDILTKIYDTAPSDKVFWIPERVADGDTLSKVAHLGFTYSLVDQMRHIFKWYGRNEALGQGGYRINRVNNNLNLLVMNDFASTFRFRNHDNGLDFPLRELLSRRSRDNVQDQILVLISDLEDFTSKDKADAYDRNVRWLANRPWIEVISLDDLADDQISYKGLDGNTYSTWGTIDRGSSTGLAMVAKDWIDHATQENYDNWYYGQPGREQGLESTVFDIRPFAPLPKKFGEIGVDGLVDDAWQEITGMSSGTDELGRLGRATLHAGMFVTGFHDQQNNDLTKFSTGAYIYPDTDDNDLAMFSRRAQSQVRFTGLYARAEQWADNPSSSSSSSAEDVDLDGENEYLLMNDQVFAVFEAKGGRLVAGFARNPDTGAVFQVVGAHPAYPGTDNEQEGASGGYRTSGFKDWFADGNGGGTDQYINDLYTVSTSGANGWTFTSSDGYIIKTILLPDGATRLQASYSLSGDVNKLFVRMGMSPDVNSMLYRGQMDLESDHDTVNHRFAVRNTTEEPVTAAVSYDGASVIVNTTAEDGVGFPVDTIPMRRQALTQQVELESQSTAFDITLSLETGATDRDNDGLPAWWEYQYFPPSDTAANPNDPAANGENTNMDAYIAGFDPNDPNAGFRMDNFTGSSLEIPTISGRTYVLEYKDDLLSPTWLSLDSRQGDGTVWQWTEPGTPRERFYRLSVELE